MNEPFGSTRWSVVLAAGRGQGPGAREALEFLCRDYWYPLYAYVRRRGHDADAARDLVQEFFTRLLERNTIAAADPARGRFRAFLLTALRNFLSNERTRERAGKRGGGRDVVSIDVEEGESRYLREPLLVLDLAKMRVKTAIAALGELGEVVHQRLVHREGRAGREGDLHHRARRRIVE